VNLDRIAKPFRQAPPGNAGPIPIENGFNEQSVVLGVAPAWPLCPGKISLILSIDRLEGRDLAPRAQPSLKFALAQDEDQSMKRKRITEEQIIGILKEHEAEF